MKLWNYDTLWLTFYKPPGIFFTFL